MTSKPKTTHNSVLRLNDKKTCQLLELYKNEECLWNTTLTDYPNTLKRRNAANKIAKLLNVPDFEGKHVLVKLKNLRNSYCQELKRIKMSLKDIEAGKSVEVYKPKVPWFGIMDSFIKPHLQSFRPAYLRSVLGGPTSLPKPDLKLEFYESDGQEDWVTHSEQSGAEVHSEHDDLSNESRPKRLKYSSNGKDEYSVDNGQDSACMTVPSERHTSSVKEDMHESFGRYIASLMRNLDQNDALQLQRKIVNMIVDVGLKDLRNELEIKKEEVIDSEDYESMI